MLSNHNFIRFFFYVVQTSGRSNREAFRSCSLPSPASTIESLTREFEHSLDIRSAIKGEYVVKPQVN